MVTLERCREIAIKHGYVYTDKELEIVREFLYRLAAIEYKAYQDIYEGKNSDHLHTGLIRRTST
jgi:hypothetical protein